MVDSMKNKNPNTLLQDDAKSATTTTTTTTTSRNHVVNSLAAGSMAGITSTLMAHPLDVLRTKMQSHSNSSNTTATSTTRQEVWKRTVHYGGGVRALYTGLSLPLAAQALYKATVFTVNQSCQQVLQHYHDGSDYHLSLRDYFCCGAMGGAVNAALFVTPVEFVRNQLIAQHTQMTQHNNNNRAEPLPRFQQKLKLSGPLHILKTTLQNDGLVGLWRGASITVARDSLGCGCFFYAFHASQQMLQNDSSSLVEPHHFGYTLISGAIAGLGFWFVALPLDTIKTLVQNQNGSAPLSARAVVLDSVKNVGLWRTVLRSCRGWQFAFGRGAPAAAVTLGTYDFCYRALEEERQE